MLNHMSFHHFDSLLKIYIVRTGFSVLSLSSSFYSPVLSLSCLLHSNVEPQRPSPQKKSAPQPSDPCNGCREVIDKVLERYSKTWKKQEDNYQKIRSQLNSKCHGSDKAIITQANTPVGSKLVYDGEKKRSLQVTPEIFSTFAKVGCLSFMNITSDGVFFWAALIAPKMIHHRVYFTALLLLVLPKVMCLLTCWFFDTHDYTAWFYFW